MRVLIFGSTGLLGLSFIFRFYNELDIIGVINKKNIKVDNIDTVKILSQTLGLDELDSIIFDKKPDAVINAAALTNIESCEKKKTETFNINTKLAENISYICIKYRTKLIHISTDSLFRGNKEYLNETTDYDTQNVYAESKAQAEKIILKNNSNALILRTSFYGWGPTTRQSLSDWIINSLRSNKEINCYKNIFFTPLFTIELSEIIFELIKNNARGIYNISCDEKLSKYQFAIELAKTLQLDQNLINSVEYSNDNVVRRPLDLSLSNSKLKKDHKIRINSIKNQFLQLQEYEQKFNDFYTKFSIN